MTTAASPEVMPVWANTILDSIKTVADATANVVKRMDSMEEKMPAKACADSEEEPKDKPKEEPKKEDSTEDPEEKPKEPAKKEDSEESDIKKAMDEMKADSIKRDKVYADSIAAMNAKLSVFTTPLNNEDRDELARIQKKADSVFGMLGEEAPASIPGEKPIDYRKRLASRLRPHSPSFKNTKMDSEDLKLPEVFETVEAQVYKDAQDAAKKLIESKPGQMIKIVSEDEAGRKITRSYGDPRSWMDKFSHQGERGLALNQMLASAAIQRGA